MQFLKLIRLVEQLGLIQRQDPHLREQRKHLSKQNACDDTELFRVRYVYLYFVSLLCAHYARQVDICKLTWNLHTSAHTYRVPVRSSVYTCEPYCAPNCAHVESLNMLKLRTAHTNRAHLLRTGAQ